MVPAVICCAVPWNAVVPVLLSVRMIAPVVAAMLPPNKSGDPIVGLRVKLTEVPDSPSKVAEPGFPACVTVNAPAAERLPLNDNVPVPL